MRLGQLGRVVLDEPADEVHPLAADAVHLLQQPLDLVLVDDVAGLVADAREERVEVVRFVVVGGAQQFVPLARLVLLQRERRHQLGQLRVHGGAPLS
ncbi:hypothetical protein ACFQV2_28565 [Actinokineospora soli]|uniref:Uncharacterized protein n=1 Tax=Actinokineospora soli TaxID=1048753 RepID=A0ABW2TWI4_9PSEU